MKTIQLYKVSVYQPLAMEPDCEELVAAFSEKSAMTIFLSSERARNSKDFWIASKSVILATYVQM
jgi:hypothetical protein